MKSSQSLTAACLPSFVHFRCWGLLVSLLILAGGLTGCTPNTRPYESDSETSGRLEWREFKKWAEESPRTMDELRTRLGNGGQRAENKGETNEVWIYENRFFDQKRKILIKEYAIPFTTNGVVKAKLPDYSN